MKKEVEEYYTIRTPDLATWHEFNDKEDFKYLAIVGYLMESAEGLAKIIEAEISTELAHLAKKLEEAEKSLTAYQIEHQQAPIGNKAYFRSRMKTKKREVRSYKNQIRDLIRDTKSLHERPIKIGHACVLFASDMPPALRVEPSTIRQDFYVSKDKTCERDYYAHQSLDQVVQTGYSK